MDLVGVYDSLAQFSYTSPDKQNSRVFHVVIRSDTVIPEDCDGNGVVTIADIDLLVGEIVAETNNSTCDLSGDGVVDGTDLNRWLSGAARENGFGDTAYLRGDANLDGFVNSLDLNSLALNWRKNDVPRWSGGDFSADGSINALDLNQLGLNWRHSIVASANTAPVPEPSSLLLALVGCLLVSRRQWRG